MWDGVSTPVQVEETPSATRAQSEISELRTEGHEVRSVQGATTGPSECLKVPQSIKDKVNLNMSAWHSSKTQDLAELELVGSESAMSQDTVEEDDAAGPPDNSPADNQVAGASVTRERGI